MLANYKSLCLPVDHPGEEEKKVLEEKEIHFTNLFQNFTLNKNLLAFFKKMSISQTDN